MPVSMPLISFVSWRGWVQIHMVWVSSAGPGEGPHMQIIGPIYECSEYHPFRTKAETPSH